MALDEIIKVTSGGARKPGNRGGRRGGRGGFGGRGRGGPLARRPRQFGNNRPAAPSRPLRAYKKSNLTDDTLWEHDMYDEDEEEDAPVEQRFGNGRDVGSGARLLISDLDYNVSEADIKDLFGSVGELKSARIHFDRSGRSKGTAEVVYVRRQDALNALKQYNGISLDGKPMKITLSTKSNSAGAARATGGDEDMDDLVISVPDGGRERNGPAPRFNRRNTMKTFDNKPRFRGRGRRTFRGGRGMAVSAETLDAELDAYAAAGRDA
jgi:THO complex subunit 4